MGELVNKVVNSNLGRRTALSLAAAALFGGAVTTASADSFWAQRAASGERVSVEAIRRGETYTRFIVHYVDAAAYGTREHAAVASMATQRIEADLSRVTSALKTPLALVRPTATGGFVFEVRNDGARGARVDAEAIMRELAKNPDVALVEPDLRMQMALTPNDTRYQDQWHYFESTAGMNLPEAWDISTGSGVVVAVIDTGITTHSDLSGQTVAGYDFISDTSVSNDGNGRDSNPADPGDAYNGNNSSWHGTHVAGTIAALTNNSKGVAGVAFNAKIQPVRVLGKGGGSLSDISDGIIWASGGSVSGVPANETPAKVINLSLGGSGSCSGTYQSAINGARQRGTVLAIAAGNSNTNVSGFQPANCSGVIAVAASDREGNRASYSNYGTGIDVTAPGGETAVSGNGVLSTLNSGTSSPGSETYSYYQGTSMATPHVAGLAALILAKASKTPDEIETLLKQNVRTLPGSCSGGCGAGLVDAKKTLQALGGGGNVAPTANFTYNVSNLTVTFSDSSSDSDGSIASREWDFGDGTTSTQTSPSKTYGAAGTYTVKLKVTDNGGLDNTKTVSITVPSSGGDTVLQNGVAKTGLSAAAGGSLDFTLVVPAGASGLKFVTTGGSGDVDVYAKSGSAPTTSSYDCKSDTPNSAETCTITTAQAGTYYVKLVAYSAFSNISLTGSYSTGGGGGDFSNTTNYTIPDPGSVTSPITVSGQSGNASATTKITVNVVHPYRGDIQLDLIAPNGQSVRLKNYDNDSGDDIHATYTVNASASAKNGQWRLRVTDVYATDAGYLDDWSIQF
jgi:serine protease